MHIHRLHRAAALLLVAAAGACGDVATAPSLRPPPDARYSDELRCTVTVADRALTCEHVAGGEGIRPAIIIGKQGVDVRLISQNADFNAGDEMFSVDVAVQNLLDQPMGTNGTVTSGTRIFFTSLPVATAGTGSVILLTESRGMFTEADQPYYEYAGTIEPRGASDWELWEFATDATVESFSFVVLVQTEIPARNAVRHLRMENGSAVPLGTAYEDIWAASTSSVFVVGNGVISHFDGHSWRGMKVDSGGPCNCLPSLLGVRGSGLRDVYAVGAEGTVLHWTGGDWTRVDDADLGTDTIQAVWAASPSDVWVVGNGGRIVHFDGTDWTQATSPTVRTLRAVWGSSATNVWAVGDNNTVLRFDGTAWSAVGGMTGAFRAVWGTSASDVWIIGRENSNAKAYRFNGTTWTQASSVYFFNQQNVWGGWSRSPNDVWLALHNTLLHFNGSTWTPHVIADITPRAVTGSGTDFVMVAGPNGSTALRDADGWKPAQRPGFFNLTAVWGSSADDVWAGAENRLLHRGANGAWTLMEPAVSNAVFVDAWGASASQVWFVDQTGGKVVFWDGSFANGVHQAAAGLHAVWGSSSADVWVAGSGGVVEHFDGTTWSSTTVGSTTLNSLWGSSPANVVVVGDNGVIHRWDGSAWTPMTSGTTERLVDVWGSGPSNVYAVGENGTVLRYDGNGGGTWAAITTPPTGIIRSIWGSGPTDIYLLVDDGRSLLHWNGSTWSRAFTLPAGTPPMNRLWGSGFGNLYAVGASNAAWRGTR